MLRDASAHCSSMIAGTGCVRRDDSFYAAAFFPSPNASASRLYDFFRAS